MRRRVWYLVMLASPLLGAHVRAQGTATGSARSSVGCGTLWVYPLTDGIVKIREVPDFRCGSVRVTATTRSWSSDGVLSEGATIEAAARAGERPLRLPLRLFVPPSEIVVFRQGRVSPMYASGMQRLELSAGDRRNETSAESFDAVRSHMWRLFVVPDDTIRASVLPPNRFTAPRTLRLMWTRDGRPDSVAVRYSIDGHRPGVPMNTSPPALNAAAQLRGVRIVTDPRTFPSAFFDGIVVIGFRSGISALARQLVLDRLEGTVIANRPRGSAEPDLVVRVGAAWRDSLLSTRSPRKLGNEVARFGILLADTEQVRSVVLAAHLADSTLINIHQPHECLDPADRRVHRRVASVVLADPSDEERAQLTTIVGGRWISHEGDRSRMELTGTRAEVARKLVEMTRLPQVSSAHLSQLLPIYGSSCRVSR